MTFKTIACVWLCLLALAALSEVGWLFYCDWLGTLKVLGAGAAFFMTVISVVFVFVGVDRDYS